MPTSLTAANPIEVSLDDAASALFRKINAGAKVELSESPKGVRVVIYGHVGDTADAQKEVRVSYLNHRVGDSEIKHSNCEIRLGQLLVNDDSSRGDVLREMIKCIDHQLYYNSGLPEYQNCMDKMFLGSPDPVTV